MIEAPFAYGLMVASSHPVEIPLSTLRLGDQLGSGGQGEVLSVLDRPGTAFKRYYLTNANVQALRALVEFPHSLEPGARDSLYAQAAWPRTCVMSNSTVAGFLMDRVPARFFGLTASKRKLRELQYLLYEPKPLWGEIVPPEAMGRIQVARAFVSLVRLMHEHSIVLCDISMSNLLWCPGPPVGIYLIDCDSARRIGLPPVLPQPQTIGWEDPQMPTSGPDLATDRYKVAMAVGRILSANDRLRPGEEWMPIPGIPANIVESVRKTFAEAAGPRSSLPEMSHWEQVLSGRGSISLTPLTQSPPHPGLSLPMVPMDDRGQDSQRDSIPLPQLARQQPAPQLPTAPLEQRDRRESIPLQPPSASPGQSKLPGAPMDDGGKEKQRDSIPLWRPDSDSQS